MRASDRRSSSVALLLWGLALAAVQGRAQEPAAAAQGPLQARADAAVEAVGAVASLRRTRDAFVIVRDFAAALGPAEQVVALLENGNDPQLPRDLGRLARIQAELDDFGSAELNYLNAIELLESAEGEFSISLLEPYQGLGRSYIKNRQFPEAVTALEQAQHISQRNLGLFNVSQTELIDDLTTAHLGMGDTVTAQRLQRERLDNAIRRFGTNNPELIPYRYQLASYYEQSRMREAARTQYEHVVTLLEARPEAGDEALLEPLRQLVRLETMLRDTDEARMRLVGILDSRPDLDAAERGRSLVVLGDSAVARDDLASARGHYAAAYDLLASAPDTDVDTVFSRPVMLDFVAPLGPVDRGERSRPYTWGTIELEFDVSADGRASNVETVAANPPGLMDDAYDRRIRETHFRPRIVGGEPRATDNVRFTHYFRYYVDRE